MNMTLTQNSKSYTLYPTQHIPKITNGVMRTGFAFTIIRYFDSCLVSGSLSVMVGMAYWVGLSHLIVPYFSRCQQVPCAAPVESFYHHMIRFEGTLGVSSPSHCLRLTYDFSKTLFEIGLLKSSFCIIGIIGP